MKIASTIKPIRRWPFRACLFAFTMAIGCGGGTADVRGRITMDGEPLTDAIVYFQPTSGPLAQSLLDEEGRYHLATPGKGSGISPGAYRVYLTEAISDEAEMAKASIRESDLVVGRAPPPPVAPQIHPKASKYYSALTSDWLREVAPGTNELDFDIPITSP